MARLKGRSNIVLEPSSNADVEARNRFEYFANVTPSS